MRSGNNEIPDISGFSLYLKYSYWYNLKKGRIRGTPWLYISLYIRFCKKCTYEHAFLYIRFEFLYIWLYLRIFIRLYFVHMIIHTDFRSGSSKTPPGLADCIFFGQTIDCIFLQKMYIYRSKMYMYIKKVYMRLYMRLYMSLTWNCI